MFTKLKLHNFKCFSDFELNLEENKTKKRGKKLAIIYGENGIGKSSIMYAFDLLKKTMSSRLDSDSFASFLNARKISEAEDRELLRIVRNRINTTKIEYFIGDYFKIDADGRMSVTYEGTLDKSGTHFKYEMFFSRTAIVEESLIIDDKLVFTAKSNEFSLSEAFFVSDDLNNLLKKDYEMYFGIHTFLSAINSRVSMVSYSFAKYSLNKNLLKLIKQFEDMDLFFSNKTNTYPIYAFTRNSKLLVNLFEGTYSSRLIKKKDLTRDMLTKFFSSLYSNIVGVDYDITTDESLSTKYTLVFIEKSDKGGLVRIPYRLESTGTNKLLTLFSYFYNAIVSDDIMLIDEIESGINDILLKNVLESFADEIKGQFIITTHNTYLLSNKNKKYTYILNRNKDSGVVTATSLDSFKNAIQEKTDVIGRYVKGMYGGLPQTNLNVKDFIK